MITTFSGRDSANTLLVQPDGKLVAVGANMARYNVNGTLDSTFGKGGKITSVNSRSAALIPVGTANAGKIIVAGSASTKKTGNDFTLTRYNTSGSVDASFGTRGVVTTDLGGSVVGSTPNQTRDVAIQPDGKIVVSGDAATGSGIGFGLARYLGSTTVSINSMSRAVAFMDAGSPSAHPVTHLADGGNRLQAITPTAGLSLRHRHAAKISSHGRRRLSPSLDSRPTPPSF